MKTLKESLFNKKILDNKFNPHSISEKDMIDSIEGFPVGVVIRMMEEQEAQGNKADVKVFQYKWNADKDEGGFDWKATEAGFDFWDKVIWDSDFDLFFKKYKEYKKYN